MCFLEKTSLEVFQLFFINKKKRVDFLGKEVFLDKTLVLQLTKLCHKFDFL